MDRWIELGNLDKFGLSERARFLRGRSGGGLFAQFLKRARRSDFETFPSVSVIPARQVGAAEDDFFNGAATARNKPQSGRGLAIACDSETAIYALTQMLRRLRSLF